MEIDSLGRIFIIRLIEKKGPISTAGILGLLETQRDVHFDLGPGVPLHHFLTWCVREGLLGEENSQLRITKAGQEILARLPSKTVEHALEKFGAAQKAAVAS